MIGFHSSQFEGIPYLALLDQQEPSDINAGGPLPYLIHTGARDEKHYGILVVADAFALTDDERHELNLRVTAKKTYKGRADDVALLATKGNLDLPLARISQTRMVHRALESVKSCFARTAWTDSERRPDANGV